MENNPIVEMMIFTMDEDRVMRDLKRSGFKEIEVSYGAPEPAVRFTGKYLDVWDWCEDNLEGGFDEDLVETMILDGVHYTMDEVDYDNDDDLEEGVNWYPL